MTTKLVQRQFLKGSREFEIMDDAVHARIKTPFREEKLTVGLSMLDPEPVINKSELEFHGRGKSGTMLSFFLNKPDTEAFSAFVETLKQRVLEEVNAFAGASAVSVSAGLSRNIYEEPPEFDAPDQDRLKKISQTVRAKEIESAIEMLKTYLSAEDIKPLLSALEALEAEPQNESNLLQLISTFNELGPMQGAVLTYAPYIGILVADDPFRNL